MDDSETVIAPSPMKLRDFLPDIFYDKHGVYMYCGFSRMSEETLGVGLVCNESRIPLQLGGDYEAIKFGEFNYHYKSKHWTDEGSYTEWLLRTCDLHFNWLYAKPKDFLEPPQMYFVSWGDDSDNIVTMRVFGFLLFALCFPLFPCTMHSCCEIDFNFWRTRTYQEL